MGGSEKSSRSSRDGGGHASSHGHWSKDKGKGKEIAGKGKAKVSQTIPEDDLAPSSLPMSSTLMGAGAQFGSQYPGEDDGSQQQPSSYSGYSQSAPTQKIAYSSYYDSVPTQQQSYGYSREPQQENTYPLASTANYVATPSGLENQFGDLQLSSPSAPNIQYSRNAASGSGGQYLNPTSDFTIAALGPSNYATQSTQGTQGRSTRVRSHGTETNREAQKKGYSKVMKNRHTQKLLGKERFKEHKSKEFVPGRVIKMYWFEPAGAHAQRSLQNGTVMTAGVYGGQGINRDINQQGIDQLGKLRRFVITETRRGHSTAIPIHTYNYQGTLKRGCHPEDHAMIYTNQKPAYLPGENGIPHPKIRMAPVSSELLEETSRINFAKKYTIEHNFLVDFIGQIHKESENEFWMTFNTVNQSFNAVNRRETFTQPPTAGPSQPYTVAMRTSAPSLPVAPPGSSVTFEASTPCSSQQTFLVSQPLDGREIPVTSEANEAFEAFRDRDRDRDRTPTSSVPSDRRIRDDREPRERRHHRR